MSHFCENVKWAYSSKSSGSIKLDLANGSFDLCLVRFYSILVCVVFGYIRLGLHLCSSGMFYFILILNIILVKLM